MSRDQARAELRELSAQRKVIEVEMEALTEVLTQEGGPGLMGNLVDDEGYPRADIDVHGILIQRNRVAST
eukprot:COSAG05_NODE_287_length_12131_cov_3.148022_1_plen_70_part_00